MNLSLKKRSTLSGISVLCLNNDSDQIVGDPYPLDGMETNNLEIDYKYRLKGEKWGCIRTDLLKLRFFPIIRGFHFPESWLWYYFSKKFKVISFNKPLRRYYTSETGITQHELRKNNDPSQARVNIKFYTWLLSRNGLYILRHHPRSFIQSCKIIVNSMITLNKR